MAETIGSLIDKLTIVELRQWHLNERISDANTEEAVRQTCLQRLPIIEEQKYDLQQELDQLWRSILEGAPPPKVYRQLKMYNDPRLRGSSD